MSNYPTGKDNLKDNTAGTDEMTAHAELHNSANDAINAIQDFVGVTQGDGSTTVVEGINIISGKVDGLVEGLEDALGVNIDIDGNITIDPDKPSIIVPESDPTKFDKGDGPLNYANATELGDAVDKLKQDGVGGGDDKFDRGTGDLEYPNAVAMGAAVRANEGGISENSTNIEAVVEALGGDINNIENIQIDALPPQTGEDGKFLTTDGSKASWDAVPSDETKFDKGTTTYKDAAEMEEAITQLGEKGYDDTQVKADIATNVSNIADNATEIAKKFDKGTGTTTLNDATVMEAAIDSNAAAITKNTNSISDISSNIGGTINADGTINFPEGVETDLSKLATKEESEAGDTANANAIEGNADDIKSLSNRLDALENTSLSAEWTISDLGGNAPADGQVSLDNAAWADVKTLNFSAKDMNGTEHDFTNVKVGDTIQIGVGASGRAAGSSAAYQVTSVTGGVFGVDHLASTGTPTVGFTAVVAVYPAFDPSNYATKGELDAVKSDKLSKGDGLKAATAKILEERIDTNEGDITTNATNISNNETAISDNSKAIDANKTNINNLVVNIGGTVDENGNIITLPNNGQPIDISGKFDKGAALAEDAKVLEDAIGTNATNIEAVVGVLGGTIDNISGIEIDALPPQTGADGKFLTTNGSEASWADIDVPDALPDNGKEGDFLSLDADGKAFWAEIEAYDDSVLRQAINANADAIAAVDKSKVSFAVNASNENLFCNNIVTLTQEEYDNLTDRDPNTLYLAVDV